MNLWGPERASIGPVGTRKELHGESHERWDPKGAGLRGDPKGAVCAICVKDVATREA